MINIGVLGAIGVDDIGDIVLLKQAINDIKIACKNQEGNVELTIFSFDVSKTYTQLEKERKLFNIKIVPALTPNEVNIEKVLEISNTTEVKNNDILFNNIHNKDYLEELLNCNALYFIGGGYFNDYWGDKLWSTFIVPIFIFNNIQKPMFISSITVGPFSDTTINRLEGVFSNIHTLFIRDHSQSVYTLKKLGYSKGNVLLNSDDVLVDWTTSSRRNPLNDITNEKYMVLHLFHWAEKYANNLEEFYKSLSGFLDYLIDMNYIEKIIFLPFNHFRDDKKGGDYIYGEKMLEYVRNKESYILLEPIYNYSNMRTIIKNASFVIANRYHPIVFSLGEKTPALGIYVNDLYKQKLQGTYEVLNINPNDHTLYINDFNKKDLVKWHKDNVLSAKFPNKYDELINSYRKQKIRSLTDFISTI